MLNVKISNDKDLYSKSIFRLIMGTPTNDLVAQMKTNIRWSRGSAILGFPFLSCCLFLAEKNWRRVKDEYSSFSSHTITTIGLFRDNSWRKND
tara:strand:+ start:242 stop:520 length:279 start_codon:yes stop_codon:yes gene_type:complete